MTTRIIVLGTLRSGTSLTAELARLWGAYAGPQKDLWASDPTDQRGYGYMEYIPLQDLNDEILENNERVPLPDESLAEKTADPNYQAKGRELIRHMDEECLQSQAPAWVWKDARLPMTLPFWTGLWEDAIYIITVRHPAETILSAARTEDFAQENIPFSAGLSYWQYCMLKILEHTQNSRRKIFVSYDQLTNAPQQECARLCHFLDEQCGLSPEAAPARLAAMTRQVAGGQRHYRYQKSLAEMEQTTREQRALYNFLRVKTLYPDEAFVKEDFALYPGWREYLQSMDMLLALSNSAES
jgi:hypothetical protein